MDTYAVLNGSDVVNVAVCDDPTFAKDQGWINITAAGPMPGIGWTTSDGGTTWVAPPVAPAVTTGAASGETATGATVTGTVNPSGQPSTYYFEYGTTTAYGSQTTSASLAAATTTDAVSVVLGGLTASTTYHYRLVASSPAGTVQGLDQTFTTTA